MMKLEPGQQFRLLTIESFKEFRLVGKVKRGFYNCICECGKKCIVRDTALTRSNGQKSCGCYRKISVKFAHEAVRNKKKLSTDEKAKRQLYSDYKVSAKRRNHELSINKEDFYKLVKQNCFYCNKEPKSSRKYYRSKIDKIYEEYLYNGLDRIDSNKGYTLDNVVTCCENCNRAKMDLTQDDFYKMVKAIYENLAKKV